jgi:hypothetical protein
LASSLAALRRLVAQAQSGHTLIVDIAELPDVDRCADPSQVTMTPNGMAAEIAGHWKGDFGHLLLRRVGNDVHGVYEHDDGVVRGTLVNGVFVGWWCEAPSRKPPGDAGDVEMKVVVDREGARAIAGRWRYGVTSNWDDRWDLTWDPSPPPAALTARLESRADDCIRSTP